jgi:hypothetical protein
MHHLKSTIFKCGLISPNMTKQECEVNEITQISSKI